MVLTCRFRVFQSHQWDTDSGLSVPETAFLGESEGCKVCPHHRRILRAEENTRLVRQGVLTLPCWKCDRPVALAKVKDGKAAECPTCKTRRERRPQDLEHSRAYNAAHPERFRRARRAGQ